MKRKAKLFLKRGIVLVTVIVIYAAIGVLEILEREEKATSS